MKMSARYVKIVEWSEEDQCYVGESLPSPTSGKDYAKKMLNIV